MARAPSALPGIGLAVTALLSYLVARDVDAGTAWAAVRSSNPAWLLLAFAAFIVAVLLRSIRWRFLFAPGTRPPLNAVARALLIGYFFNNGCRREPATVVGLHRSAATAVWS